MLCEVYDNNVSQHWIFTREVFRVEDKDTCGKYLTLQWKHTFGNSSQSSISSHSCRCSAYCMYGSCHMIVSTGDSVLLSDELNRNIIWAWVCLSATGVYMHVLLLSEDTQVHPIFLLHGVKSKNSMLFWILPLSLHYFCSLKNYSIWPPKRKTFIMPDWKNKNKKHDEGFLFKGPFTLGTIKF